MPVTTNFKQECPTCGATVKIDEKMLGKKVECTKCKDKFVAERPDDEEDEVPRTKKKAGANGKKPSKPIAEEAEEVDLEDDAEPVQVKTSRGKPGANGKAKKSDEDNDSDDESEGKSKGKGKKGGASNKLTIGLALAVVGVLVLGVAAFFLLQGRRSPDTPRGGPTTPGKKDDSPGEKKGDSVTPGDSPRIEAVTTPLNDAELARLSNLLPNDTEDVFHLFFRELFGPTGSLHEAVFKTSGALDNFTMTRRLGFSLASVDDVIRAERYTAPSWKYTVIHFKDALDEKQLKTALNLKLGGAPIDGQVYYKMTDPHPVFDVLGRFSFGIPNLYRILEPRRSEQPTFLRIYNAQTLIVGDEGPLVALLKSGGQFPLLTARSAPPPAPAPSTPPPDKTPAPGTTPDGKTEPDSKPTPKLGPKTVPGPKGRPMPGAKDKNPAPGGASDSFPFRPRSALADNSPRRFDASLVSLASFEQGGGPQDNSYLDPKLRGTGWKGPEKTADKLLYLTFSDKGELRVSSDMLSVVNAPGEWQIIPTEILTFFIPKASGISYRFEVTAPGQMKGTGRDSAGGSWEVLLTQVGGPPVLPPPEYKSSPQGPGAVVEPGSSPTYGPMLVYQDRYLTIPPALKAVLDRMEARTPDNPERVLMSSTTHMEASRIMTSLPEFRDRVVRRPRQFWDITVMLTETTPCIRTLGTSVLQRGEMPRFQLRNEITCGQDSEAAAFKKEIMESTSYVVKDFLWRLVKHEVRLPVLPKKAPPPDPKAKPGDEKKKPAPVSTSHMTVNRHDSKVDFLLDLVLDNSAMTQMNIIAVVTAGALRAETEAAASGSIRHVLSKAGKTVAEKGMSDRDVPPGRFPPGAFLRAKTPFHVDQEPRNRISWMASLLPFMGQKHLYDRVKFDQSWREPANWIAGNALVPQFLDPSYPDYLRRVNIAELPLDFGATHYVGIAGIGLDAASYSRTDPATDHKRGVFSYDGSASLDEIQKGRGLSNTMVMIQIPYDGATGVSPWIAGGGATLRGVPEKNSIAPFVLSRDKNDKPIEHQGKRGTFVQMADGSVRFVDQNVSDDVFKAMATVQGPAPENFNLNANPSTPLLPAPAKEDDVPVFKPLEKKPDVPDKTPTPAKNPALVAFVVPGQFSIDTPAEFIWRYMETKVRDGRTFKFYACVGPNSKGLLNILNLSVEEKKLDTDEQKRKLITEDLAGSVAEAKQGGVILTEDIKPNLKSPISAQVEYRFVGKMPDSSTLVVHGKTIFGRAVYDLTAFAATPTEAQALLKIADSFKELPASSAGVPVKQAAASGRHEGAGRVHDSAQGISIIPPKGWKQNTQSKPGQYLVFLGPVVADFAPNMNVRIAQNDGTPIEKLVPQIKEALKQFNANVFEEGFVQIDGKKAFMTRFKAIISANQQKLDLTIIQYSVISSNNRVFTMTFGALSNTFDQHRKALEQSALSAQVD